MQTKEQRALYDREYRIKNKDRIKARIKANAAKINEQRRKRYNKEKNKIQCDNWKNKNRSKLLTYKKNYYLKNLDKIKEYNKQRKEIKNNNESIRLRIDPIFRISKYLRNRLYAYIKRKSKKTKEIVGCSFGDLKQYLENQFQPGMTWENHGSWHIDHVIPLASAKTEEELYKLCHYTNLQPLWAADNIRKGAKIIYDQDKKP
jgi:hypothetical protein